MNALQDHVFLRVDKVFLAPGKATPKHEHQFFAVVAEGLDGRVGEGSPAQLLMAVGSMGPHGEGGIEQEHSLTGPSAEVAVGRHVLVKVGFYLLKDRYEILRHGYSL